MDKKSAHARITPKIAIIGLGWLGLPLAQSFLKKGYTVTGTTRRSEKLMGLLQSQLAVRIIRVDHDTIRGDWKKFIADTHVLIIAIPPGRTSEKRADYPKKMELIAQSCPAGIKVIFISSTSVYGDHEGKVTEETTPHPSSESGKAVLAAETVIQKHFSDRLTIIRMSGLYGPGRHPGRFLEKTNVIKRPQGQINLIHQIDCIELIQRVILQDQFGQIINGCADHHPNREEFYQKAAFDLHLDAPEPDHTDETKGKVVTNEKSVSLLGMVYQHSNPLDYFSDSK